ncbi:MAG TPA: ABC transporter ATP-binding protein [Acidimicrobiia bacterium]
MLALRDIALTLGGRPVLDGVALDVGATQVVALLGASGSGKSTLLRIVAGLLPTERGTVCWDGRDLADVPSHRRGFGMLFQDHVLFPHRDVRGNVELGLRLQHRDPAFRHTRVAEMLDLVGLAGYERRRVTTLSGGEQQRVALARALAPSPRLVLLDEPFGALDRPLRDRLVADVGDIIRGAGVPAIVVTHDRDEAFALADSVGVLAGGRIVQCAPPNELWEHPASEHVASLIGLGSAVDATVQGATLVTPWGALPAPAVCASRTGGVRLLLRPDGLVVDGDGSLDAVVRRVAPHGGRTMVELALGGDHTLWAAPPRDGVALASGANVRVRIEPDALVVFDSVAVDDLSGDEVADQFSDAGTSSPPAASPAGVANDQ